MDGRASYTPVSHFSISYHLVVLIFLPIHPPDLTLDFHFPQKPNQSPRSRLSTRFDPTTRSYTNNVLSNVPHPTHTRSREHPPAHSRALTHAHKHTHTHSYTHSYTHHQPYLNYELGYMLERQLLYREATSTA